MKKDSASKGQSFRPLSLHFGFLYKKQRTLPNGCSAEVTTRYQIVIYKAGWDIVEIVPTSTSTNKVPLDKLDITLSMALAAKIALIDQCKPKDNEFLLFYGKGFIKFNRFVSGLQSITSSPKHKDILF